MLSHAIIVRTSGVVPCQTRADDALGEGGMWDMGEGREETEGLCWMDNGGKSK